MYIQFLLIASFFVIVYAWPAFILPLILGSVLLIKFREDDLSRALGWLTLKPIPATFLLAWYLAIFGSTEGEIPYYALLPGVILTILISLRFRTLFGEQIISFSFFLMLDAVRWINTFLMLSPWVQPTFNPDNPQGPFYIFALILPNVYGLAAISVGILRARKRKISTPISVS